MPIGLISPVKTQNGGGHWLDRFTYDIFDGVTHTSTFFIDPQVFWGVSGWQALNFEDHYSTNGYYLIQNAHITVKIYEWFSVFLDPDNQRVCVDDERWIVEVWNGKMGKWREVDLYNPRLSFANNETHLSVTRSLDTYEGLYNITYIISQGSLLKHDVVFKSKMENEHEFRASMILTGIYSDKVKHSEGSEIITSEKHILTPYFIIGENATNLVLSEYLEKLGQEINEVWQPTTLKDVIFNPHAKGCKAVIVIGNYSLSQNEMFFIDPDSSTFTPPDKDAFIDENNPDNNYGGYSFLKVKSYKTGGTSANSRTLIQWGISAIQENSVITSATIHLECYSAGASGRTYQFRRIVSTASWQEMAVTWNNQPAINETSGVNYPAPTSTGEKWYLITDMVQNAHDEGENIGVRIKDAIEDYRDSVESRYYAKEYGVAGFRPHLVVVWTPPDLTSPTYFNVGTNTTLEGEQCLFHVKWIDNVAMHGYIFGWNDSGTFQNDTWAAWGVSGSPKWANITNRLTRIATITISWEVWANDTSNNWNNTGLQSFVITADPFNFELGIAAGALLTSIIVGIIAYVVASNRKR